MQSLIFFFQIFCFNFLDLVYIRIVNQTQMNLNENSMHTGSEESCRFIYRFQSLPLVNSTCYWLFENYNKIKEKNFVTKCTCDLAETTLKSSIYLAAPIVKKFKSQVNVLDFIACNQLDKLESAFPIIKSQPDMILSQSKELIKKTVKPAVTRYTNFKINTENQCKTVREKLSWKKTTVKLINISHYFLEYHFIFEEISSSPNMEKVEEYVQVYLDYKDKIACKELNYEILFKHIRILIYVLFYSIEAKITRYSNESIRFLKAYFCKLFKLFEYYDALRQNVNTKLREKFHVTKEKIDLYKEYLDVLSKQFTVQDGRQLSSINVIYSLLINFHVLLNYYFLSDKILKKPIIKTTKKNNFYIIY